MFLQLKKIKILFYLRSEIMNFFFIIKKFKKLNLESGKKVDETDKELEEKVKLINNTYKLGMFRIAENLYSRIHIRILYIVSLSLCSVRPHVAKNLSHHATRVFLAYLL